MPEKLHERPPAHAHWNLLVCLLDIALAGLLSRLAQLCSLEIQLLHVLETALQFPWQFCGACMTAIGFSTDYVEHKASWCWRLTINKWLQIPCHEHSVLSMLQFTSGRSCGSHAAANLKGCSDL